MISSVWKKKAFLAVPNFLTKTETRLNIVHIGTIHTINHSLFYENISSFDKSDGLQISVTIITIITWLVVRLTGQTAVATLVTWWDSHMFHLHSTQTQRWSQFQQSLCQPGPSARRSRDLWAVEPNSDLLRHSSRAQGAEPASRRVFRVALQYAWETRGRTFADRVTRNRQPQTNRIDKSKTTN